MATTAIGMRGEPGCGRLMATDPRLAAPGILVPSRPGSSWKRWNGRLNHGLVQGQLPTAPRPNTRRPGPGPTAEAGQLFKRPDGRMH
jgi:hypothetical protein